MTTIWYNLVGDDMIDIIIPVYNTPKIDLERCLNSIIKQTYRNYKVYIIDDGSNDITKNYLDDFVNNKNNFIAKHIKNKGVSNARNLGIDISNSKYITFVDADDTIEKNFLEANNVKMDRNLYIESKNRFDLKRNKEKLEKEYE